MKLKPHQLSVQRRSTNVHRGGQQRAAASSGKQTQKVEVKLVRKELRKSC